MSSSPAWLTIALTTLSSSTTPSPHEAFTSGIRALPTTHILHHLNRWARHVWRPAVSSPALSALTRAPTLAPLPELGAGAVALLAALVDAIRRCEVVEWLDVLGVMFLADDPWTVEVGRCGEGDGDDDAGRAAHAMKILYGQPALLEEAVKTAEKFVDFSHVGLENGAPHESFAEVRCRLAALQLQLDDVTAVVRRNEKQTTDLISSFHFWSLLLLDELRGYRQESAGMSAERASREVALETYSRQLAKMSAGSSQSGSDRGERREVMDVAPIVNHEVGNVNSVAKVQRPKRVFRDGKWVEL